MESTQVRKHIRAIFFVPHAGLVEGGQVGGGERGSCDRQRNGLIQSLLAGKAQAPLFRLVRMLVAISAPAFDTGPQ